MGGKSSKEERDTALVFAANNGDTRKVEELLSQGSRVDTRNKNGFTPLLAAAQRGHTEVCKLLLETGKTDIEETLPDGNTALNLAAAQRRLMKKIHT